MLLDAVETVPLRVGPRLEVLGTGGIVIDRLFDGRDEVSEQHVGRRRLGAVVALMHVLERFRRSSMASLAPLVLHVGFL